MRTQIWIIGAAFFVFGLLAFFLVGRFSPAFVGLMLIGVAAFGVGAMTSD